MNKFGVIKVIFPEFCDCLHSNISLLWILKIFLRDWLYYTLGKEEDIGENCFNPKKGTDIFPHQM